MTYFLIWSLLDNVSGSRPIHSATDLSVIGDFSTFKVLTACLASSNSSSSSTKVTAVRLSFANYFNFGWRSKLLREIPISLATLDIEISLFFSSSLDIASLIISLYIPIFSSLGSFDAEKYLVIRSCDDFTNYFFLLGFFNQSSSKSENVTTPSWISNVTVEFLILSASFGFSSW